MTQTKMTIIRSIFSYFTQHTNLAALNKLLTLATENYIHVTIQREPVLIYLRLCIDGTEKMSK